jgi:quinol monooxygenase YgiN
MVILRVTLRVISDKRLEITQTLLSMIEPTIKEKGCLSYSVLADLENENHIDLLEEWESREDLDEHIRSHRFGVMLGLKTLLFQPLEIKIHTISTSEGMDAVNFTRINKN